MKIPRLSDLACSTVTDQAGLPVLVILGVDAYGTIWIKQGAEPWRKVSRLADDPPA